MYSVLSRLFSVCMSRLAALMIQSKMGIRLCSAGTSRTHGARDAGQPRAEVCRTTVCDVVALHIHSGGFGFSSFFASAWPLSAELVLNIRLLYWSRVEQKY